MPKDGHLWSRRYRAILVSAKLTSTDRNGDDGGFVCTLIPTGISKLSVLARSLRNFAAS